MKIFALPLILLLMAAFSPAATAQGPAQEIAARAAILADPAVPPADKVNAANYLLGQFDAGNKDAIAPIVNVLNGDDSPESQANMLPVLGALGENGLREGLFELVVGRLSSTNAEMRSAAFKTLSGARNISSDLLYPKVIAMVQDPQQPDLARIAAARLIGRIGNAAAAPALENVLKTEPNLAIETRIEVVRALGELKTLSAVEYLISLIDPNNKKFSSAVVDALEMITFHNFGLDQEAWNAFWAMYRGETREKLVEDFIKKLQNKLADSVKMELAGNIKKILEIMNYTGADINPPSMYGERYPEMVEEAVKILAQPGMTLSEEDFALVTERVNKLLLYDDDAVKRAVLANYFSAASAARQDKSSMPALLGRYSDALESAEIRSLALVALKNVVDKVVGGNPAVLDPAALTDLENAMVAALASLDQAARLTAVDILGSGLRSRNALMSMAKLLEFQDAPDPDPNAITFRVRICQSLHAILTAPGRPALDPPTQAALIAVLGRCFLKDEAIRQYVPLPLADAGYETSGASLVLIEIEGAKYDGPAQFLGAWLAEGKPPALIEAILVALTQVNNPKGEEVVLAALDNEKIIPRTPPADKKSLAEVALGTLKVIGGNATLSRILQGGWLANPVVPVRNAAWQAALGCANKLLAAGEYDMLLSYQAAIESIPPEADGTPSKEAQMQTLGTLKAGEAKLKEAREEFWGSIGRLNPADPNEAAAMEQIKQKIAQNPSLLGTLIEALGPSSTYSAEIKAEAHKLLVEITGAQDIPNEYAKWKEWYDKNK